MVFWTNVSRRRALGVVALLAVIALVLDLKLSSVKDIQVKSLTLDATQPLPYASLEVVFAHGSRFSSVKPKAVRCHVPEAGDVLVQVTERPHHAYAIEATCRPNDVEAHAAWMWDLLTSKNNEKMVNFTCEMDVGVRFGHLVPWERTVTFYSSSKVEHQPQDSHSGQIGSPSTEYPEPPSFDYPRPSVNTTENQSEDSQGGQARTSADEVKPKPKSEIKENQWQDSQSGQVKSPSKELKKEPSSCGQGKRPLIEVKQMSMQNLKLAFGVELPKSSHRLAPQATVIKIPPLVIDAEPDTTDQEGGVLTVEAFDGVFYSDTSRSPCETDDGNLLLFGFTCGTTQNCPWFRPMLDLFLTRARSGSRKTTIQVTVEGNGSFMETLLGRQHQLSIQSGPTSSSHRHLLSDTREEAETTCLSIGDDSGDFDVSLCWLLTLSEGFILVGDVSFVEFAVSGFTEVGWELLDSRLELDMKALFEMGDNSEIMDTVGTALVDWEDDFRADLTLINSGTWWPFRVDFFSNATITADDVFTVKIKEATISTENTDVLTGAIGSLEWKINENTMDAELQDQDLQFTFSFAVLDDESMLGSSKIVRDNVIRWDSSLDGSIFEKGDDVSNMLINLKEETHDYTISIGSTLDRSARSLSGFIDDSTLKVDLNGTVLEQESAFVGGLGWSLDGDDVVKFRWDGRVDSIEDENTIAMSFDEAVSEFSMEGEFGILVVGDVATFLMDYFLVGLGRTQYVDMTGKATVDIDRSEFKVYVEDNARLNLTANATVTWFSTPNMFGGEVEQFVVTRDSGILFEVITATFQDEEGTGSLLIDSKDSVKFWVGLDMTYAVGEDDSIFAAQFDRIMVGWENDALAEIDGQVIIGVDPVSFQVFMEDTTTLDMVANATARWSSESDAWGGILDKAFLEVDSEVYADMNGHFLLDFDGSAVDGFMEDSGDLDFETNVKSRWFHETDSWGLIVDDILLKQGSDKHIDCAGDFTFDQIRSHGALDFETSPESDLKMAMVMEFSWHDDEEALMMVIDHMMLGWKDTIYVEAGVDGQGDDSPTQTEQSYSFTGVTMRLEGAPSLTDESRTAFEKTTEDFYRSIYQSARRRLQQNGVTNFDTKVTVTGDVPDSQGNTVIYDQTLSFTNEQTEMDEGVGRKILESPFTVEPNKQQFIDLLGESNEDYSSVTGISPPSVPEKGEPTQSPTDTEEGDDSSEPTQPPTTDTEKEDDSSKSSVPIIVGILAGVLLCCGCGIGLFFGMKKGLVTLPGSGSGSDHMAEKDEELIPENHEHAQVPEIYMPENDFRDESSHEEEM